MTSNDLIGRLCAHKIAVRSKQLSGDILTTDENYCHGMCSGTGYKCDGYIPLQDVREFDKLFFEEHIHPLR